MSFYTGNNNNSNFIQKFKNTFGNIFGGGSSQPQTIGGNQTFNTGAANNAFTTPNPANPSSGYYQIKSGDTFPSIASNYGTTPNAIQGANNGMLIPPPKGSYINLPTAGSGTPIPNVPSPSQYYNNNTLANPSLTFNNPHMGRVFPNTTQPNAAYQKADYAGTIQDQIESGSLPATIPASLQTQLTGSAGQPLSNTDLQNAGYVLDPKTQTWKLSGSGAANSAGVSSGGNGAFANTASQQAYAAAGTNFYNQKRWDPQRKKYVPIGQLIREGKLNIHSQNGKFYGRHGGGGRGGGNARQQPQGGYNSTTSGETVLGLHLGGG